MGEGEARLVDGAGDHTGQCLGWLPGNASIVHRGLESVAKLISTEAPDDLVPLLPSQDRGPVAEGPGTRIGVYKILQVVGEGGFGVVYMSEQEEPFRRKVARYGSFDLLCIDEVGYLAYDAHAADLLYKVLDRRYERRAILLTTNLAFRDWHTVFPNATSIATLLDKLTHHADMTLLEGESYRAHESKQEAAQRRRKKPKR